MTKRTAMILALITATALGGGTPHARAATRGGSGIPFAEFRGLSTSVASFHRWIENPMNKAVPVQAGHADEQDDARSARPDRPRPFAGLIGLRPGAWAPEKENPTRIASVVE